MPPTTPPAIAPALEECEDSLEPCEELVSDLAVEVPDAAAAATLIEVASVPSASGIC